MVEDLKGDFLRGLERRIVDKLVNQTFEENKNNFCFSDEVDRFQNMKIKSRNSGKTHEYEESLKLNKKELEYLRFLLHRDYTQMEVFQNSNYFNDNDDDYVRIENIDMKLGYLHGKI